MDVHRRLKEKTQVYHQQIERAPLVNQLINGSIDMAAYHALLKKFHAYILPCERLILASPWQSLLDTREKTSSLSSDLMDLGLSNNRECQVLPALNSREEILGYLYVIEGSTLGGQIIAQILQDRLGLSAQYGARYFNGYGPDTMEMWAAFCHLLNEENPSQERQILVSASMTYTVLIDWLNKGWS